MKQIIFIFAFFLLFFFACKNLTTQKEEIQLSQGSTLRETPSSMVTLHAHRDEIRGYLSRIARALAFLSEDGQLSQIIADQCLLQAYENDYNALLENVRNEYLSQTGNDLYEMLDAIEVAHYGAQTVSISTFAETLQVENVALKPRISLFFLNDNGDFTNTNWDGITVHKTCVGQFRDLTKASYTLWSYNSTDLAVSEITEDDAFNSPIWFVGAYLDENKIGEEPGTYDELYDVAAKCYCYTNPSTGANQCSKTYNLTKCKCKGGTCRSR